MAVKCGACAKFVSAQQGGASCSCHKCKLVYHKACVGIAKDQQPSLKWLCPECVASTPRAKDHLDKPVRGTDLQYPLEMSPPCTIADQDSAGREELSQTRSLLREFREEFQAMLSEMRAVRVEMQELRDRVSAVEQRQTALEARIEAVEQQAAAGGPSDVRALESTIDRLKLDLDDRDRELLLTDLEVSGVPEESGENVYHLVRACANKIGVDLQEQDIVSCGRVGAVRGAVEGAASPRARLIAVRLARRATRDSVLRAARVRRHTTTEGITVRGASSKVYWNERLTRSNRSLFGLARQIRKELNFVPHVWTSDGKVFARREQGAPRTRIRSEQDIERVFGADSVRRARSNRLAV